MPNPFYYVELEKDRTTARMRHHHEVRAKKSNEKNASILASKLNKLPAKATGAEIAKATQKAENASKKADRIKKH